MTDRKEDSIEPSPSQTGGRLYVISESERQMFIRSTRFILFGLIALMCIVAVMGILIFTVIDRGNYLTRAVDDLGAIRHDIWRIAQVAEAIDR